MGFRCLGRGIGGWKRVGGGVKFNLVGTDGGEEAGILFFFISSLND